MISRDAHLNLSKGANTMYYRFTDGTELYFDWYRAQDDKAYADKISRMIRLRQDFINDKFEKEAAKFTADWTPDD